MINLKVLTIPYVVKMKQDFGCKLHHKTDGKTHQGTMKENTIWWACRVTYELKEYIVFFNMEGHSAFWSTDEVKTTCSIIRKELGWITVFRTYNEESNYLKFKYNES